MNKLSLWETWRHGQMYNSNSLHVLVWLVWIPDPSSSEADHKVLVCTLLCALGHGWHQFYNACFIILPLALLLTFPQTVVLLLSSLTIPLECAICDEEQLIYWDSKIKKEHATLQVVWTINYWEVTFGHKDKRPRDKWCLRDQISQYQCCSQKMWWKWLSVQ